MQNLKDVLRDDDVNKPVYSFEAITNVEWLETIVEN